MNKPYEGLFITLEGGDGSGKSTLSKALVAELEKRGYPLLKTREPGGSTLSEQVRELLLTPDSARPIGDRAELLLFLAARAEHIEEKILPALRKGHTVVCERFNDSTIAYQGCARHLGMHHVEDMCHLATNGLTPDATLFLDLPPAEGLKRVVASSKQSDRLEQEALQFHVEVRQGFLHLADKYPQRITILDATLPPEEVLKQALEALEPKLLPKPIKQP